MICISLAEKDISSCIEILKEIELAEIRLDLVDYTLEDVSKVFSSHSGLVATCRPAKYPEEVQLEYLKTAIEAGAKYVDIEYEAPERYRQELLAFAKKKECEVIISYHNYKQTPSQERLMKIIDEIIIWGANVVKIATMVNHKNDAATILGLYNRKLRMVALGMGEEGKITRLIAPFLGAEFTFATLDETKNTAPGQVTKEKLIEAIEIINKL